MAEESDSNMVCCGPGTGRDRNEASGFGASRKIRLVEYFNNLCYFTLILVSTTAGVSPPKLLNEEPLEQLKNIPQQEEVRR